MRFWAREVAGWALLALGLYIFYACFDFLLKGRVIEAGSLTVIGVFVFRGGIHLLKVAVAARVCMEARAPAVARPVRHPISAANTPARAVTALRPPPRA
jgi:hypothetical protein